MKNLFKKGPTSKADVVFAIASAVVAIWKTIDTTRQYKADRADLTKEKKK